MTVRYHNAVPVGRRHELNRRAVLADIADLPAWLAEKQGLGEPIYLLAEPLHGPLGRWRETLEKRRG